MTCTKQPTNLVRIILVPLFCACSLVVTSCGTTDRSQAYYIYKKCTESWYQLDWNNKPNFKALVGGDSSTNYNCFAAWGAGSQQAAVDTAMRNCSNTFGKSCFIYATGTKLTEWVQKRADNITANNSNSEASGGGAAEAFMAFLGGFVQGAALAKGTYIPNYGLPGSVGYQNRANTSQYQISNQNVGSSSGCTPMPPRCSSANSRAEQLIKRFPRTTGIVDPASQAYCAMLVGIEVNSFCASEYRNQGRHSCAQIVDQQVAAYRRNLPATMRTIRSASISQIRNACSWERR